MHFIIRRVGSSTKYEEDQINISQSNKNNNFLDFDIIDDRALHRAWSSINI